MVQKNEAGDLSSAWDGQTGPDVLPLTSALALAASSFHIHLSVSWDLGKVGQGEAGGEKQGEEEGGGGFEHLELRALLSLFLLWTCPPSPKLLVCSQFMSLCSDTSFLKLTGCPAS